MSIEQKEKYSKGLVILGVIAWAPYIISQLNKNDISALPFLGLHLIGVLGGLTLRRQIESGQDNFSEKKQLLKKISTILLLLGVSVWGVYFGLEWFTGLDREVTPFLIAHLIGVLSGAAIKLYIFFSKD